MIETVTNQTAVELYQAGFIIETELILIPDKQEVLFKRDCNINEIERLVSASRGTWWYNYVPMPKAEEIIPILPKVIEAHHLTISWYNDLPAIDYIRYKNDGTFHLLLPEKIKQVETLAEALAKTLLILKRYSYIKVFDYNNTIEEEQNASGEV